MKTRKFLIAAIMSALTWAGTARAEDQQAKPTIVLVHGAWRILQAGTASSISCSKTVTMCAPYRIHRGLAADAAVVATYLKSVAGPGSGGPFLWRLGNKRCVRNAPNVKALVYVDAFAPDADKWVEVVELASAPPPPPDCTIAVPFTSPDGNGADLYVNAKYFGAVFASAEPPDVAARLAATQRPFAARCLMDKTPEAVGWKTIPSWYVIGDADKVIPPDIQPKFAARAKSKIYHVPRCDHPT